MFSVISKPAELQTFSLEAVFVLVGAIAVAGCILVPEAGLVVVIGCVALWFLALVGEAVRQNRRNPAVLGRGSPARPLLLIVSSGPLHRDAGPRGHPLRSPG